MTPKLIALDLDGTALDRESRLSPGNRAALEAAVARGIEIVVATGRAYAALPEEIRNFPGIRYAITGNGAAVWDLRGKEPLRRYVLPPEAAERILLLTQGERLTYEATVDGKIYAQEDYIRNPGQYLTDGRGTEYIQRTRRPAPDIQTFIRRNSRELDSLNLVVGDLTRKPQIMERLRPVESVYITTSTDRLIEISHRDSGKHRGLQFLAERLGVDQRDTAAFGNHDNDAEMLAWAGAGVAVENASGVCKAAADHTAPPHWADAVAWAFRELFEIP